MMLPRTLAEIDRARRELHLKAVFSAGFLYLMAGFLVLYVYGLNEVINLQAIEISGIFDFTRLNPDNMPSMALILLLYAGFAPSGMRQIYHKYVHSETRLTMCPNCSQYGEDNANMRCLCGEIFLPRYTLKWVPSDSSL